VRKLFGVLLVVALVLSVSMAATTPVAAQTDRLVPSQYDTIQDAIDAAAAGDTIIVAAGHLAEESIIVGTDDLKLTTDESDPATILYDAGGTTPTIDISAGRVTIENFNIERKGGDAGARAVIVRRSGATIQGAVVSGPGPGMALNAFGILVDEQDDDEIDDVSIAHNTFESLLRGIVVSTRDSARVEIVGNTFNEVDYAVMLSEATGLDVVVDGNKGAGTLLSGSSAVLVYDYLAVSTVWNVEITGNAFDSYHHGVYVLPTAQTRLDVRVEDNTFTDMGWGGVTLWDDAGTSASWNVIVDSNRIENSPRGVYLFGRGTLDATITSNRILDNSDGTHGAGVYVHTLTSSDVVTINDNWIEGNSPRGIRNNTAHEVDARWNWWGHASGPGGVGPGTGDAVSANVDFSPWYFLEDLRIPITSYDDIDDTATGTGPARFGASEGTIANLRTVDEADLPVEGKPYLAFPHGFFALDIEDVTPGGEVTVSIMLPQRARPGTEYWKYYLGAWHQIPMTIDPIDPRIIHITLVDGGLGDASGTPDGTIIDQGGPGNPVTVGWEGSSVDRAAVMAPWLAVVVTVIAGATLIAIRRRRAQT